ncbi:hypothetical protein PM082_022062 [Marasmius tenuissimus]|nr:hypothetical protein PM082_022062 [Marasmius tenuissimus]
MDSQIEEPLEFAIFIELFGLAPWLLALAYPPGSFVITFQGRASEQHISPARASPTQRSPPAIVPHGYIPTAVLHELILLDWLPSHDASCSEEAFRVGLGLWGPLPIIMSPVIVIAPGPTFDALSIRTTGIAGRGRGRMCVLVCRWDRRKPSSA